MKIAYVKHPVSPELKDKIRAQGYTILDARFAPEGEKVFDTSEEADAKDTGSAQQDEEYSKLVAEYEERFGQKPHPKAKAETIRQKLAETE